MLEIFRLVPTSLRQHARQLYLHLSSRPAATPQLLGMHAAVAQDSKPTAKKLISPNEPLTDFLKNCGRKQRSIYLVESKWSFAKITENLPIGAALGWRLHFHSPLWTKEDRVQCGNEHALNCGMITNDSRS